MTGIEKPDSRRVDAMVRAALEEDGAQRDVTAEFVGLGDRVVDADIRVSAPVTLSGMDVAREVFRRVDATCGFESLHDDGEEVPSGTQICRLRGAATSIVAAERTALNFLQRMCGVATEASRYVTAVAGTGVVVLDTRKTVPLWRELDKYAVRCGGAQNHRRTLDAMILVKDNHVRAIGGPQALVERLSRAKAGGLVEVEVDSLEFLRNLLAVPVDRIMLDNFSPEEVGLALGIVGTSDRRIEIEVSGGITLESIRAYALPGVDFISVGAMTHSAPAAPMSLSIL